MEIKGFRGLRNTASEERLGKGYLSLAQNVDIDDTLKLMTRLGQTLAQAGSFHSLWADEGHCFVMQGNDLKRVELDFTLTQLTRLTASARVAYVRAANTIYLSNGFDALRVAPEGIGPWGLEGPISQPAAAPGAGVLPAGRYMYALTFERSDGTESGTGTPGVIDLAEAGGIALSGIESTGAAAKILYLSGPNGTELFRAARIAPTRDSVTLMNVPAGARLETLYCTPPPAGTALDVHSGVMYVVRGNVVYYSDPYAYERFRPATQFLQFPGPVTLFASVNDGIYVATHEATWFLPGRDPRAMEGRVVFNYGAIPGTAVKTTVGSLKTKDEAREGSPEGTAVLWTTPHGVCIGAEGGQAANLTERDFSFPSAQRGAAIVRQSRGITQYLSALEGTGVAANAYQ